MSNFLIKIKKRIAYHFEKKNKLATVYSSTLTSDDGIDITSHIVKNPISKLSAPYNNRLLIKIKNVFSDANQVRFISSFYHYLNYSKNDNVINFDDVWEWLGYIQKTDAKRFIENHFLIGVDKKASLGRESNILMLSQNQFKSLCLKIWTAESVQTYNYYILLEEALHDIIEEESKDLKIQFSHYLANSERDRQLVRESTILEQFGLNTQSIYIGIIDDRISEDEPLIKFGCSNELCSRVKQHKRTFSNFRLVYAYKVENKTMVENMIKSHPLLVGLRRTMNIYNVNYTELLAIDVKKLDKIIKDIITNVEFSPDNYKRLLEENEKLKRDISSLAKKKGGTITPKPKYLRGEDKSYHINGNVFKKLTGTKEDVWLEVAYKTSGSLIKSDLFIGKDNKIIRKEVVII